MPVQFTRTTRRLGDTGVRETPARCRDDRLAPIRIHPGAKLKQALTAICEIGGMTTTGTSPVEASGAERRREQRYDVNLNGDLGVDGEILPVTIGDLSGSGAMLVLDRPPRKAPSPTSGSRAMAIWRSR